ncbi:MAG TPA: hypothetical protein VMV10_17295, partial [Pirellulales bacterium]|nr:hypothetical protein [Pirellulales bacterium]
MLRVFGFCLMLAGVLLLALSLFVLMLGRAGAISLVAVAALGLGFTVAGLVSSEKTIIVVDKRAASLSITSKWPGWQENKTYPLSDFRRVAIVRYWNRSRHGSRKLYRIVLERSAYIRHAAKNEAGLKVWKLWVIRDCSCSRCSVGIFAKQPSMAAWNSWKV